MIGPFIFIAFSYLLGSIPFAYIVGKLFHGKDITKIGNQNVGTVNAWRELGWRTGLMVLILDTAKGVVVMALILGLGISEVVAFAAAMAVILGHNFSIFLNFNSGKGAATVLGLSLVIFPFFTLLSLIFIPIMHYFTRSIIWSFLVAFIILNTLIIVTGQAAVQIGLCITLSLVVIATHIWRTRTETIAALLRLDFVRIGQIE